MARIYPFRAWRYNPAVVRLQDVVTQPYDKISPAMQQAYYQRSPYNLVRIILGLPELFDAGNAENVYTRAARDFSAWRRQGVLIQEKEPCLFAYSQRFGVPATGAVQERRGFIALGKLHEYSEQVVFRHERTLSQPKSDRLNLLKATHAHFEQIFMLYSDPARTVDRLLFEGSGPPDGEATDEYGVLHRIWRVADPATIRLVSTAMEDKKLIIADGHHRYETALSYARDVASRFAAQHGNEPGRRESYTAPPLAQPPYPEGAAMMTFVNMDAEGLLILPTHRVVHDLPGFDPKAFAQAAGEFFTVKALPAGDPREYLLTLNAQTGTAFVAVTRAGALLLNAKSETMRKALADLPARERQLDLTQLHCIVLERLLGLNAEKVREETNLRYLRDPAEAVEQVLGKHADIALLTRPVTMNQLREVAFAGDVMPQKSTDFYPKLLSGLAIYALE